MRTALLTLLLASTTLLLGCTDASSTQSDDPADTPDVDISALAQPDTATFAGGCFWCMEPPFDRTEGVVSTISGFAGGTMEDPTYRQVASGQTDHTETVQIVFDTTKVDVERLLYVYWRNVDPITDDRQFCDAGAQYRPDIFVSPAKPEHKNAALESKKKVQERFEDPVVVDVYELDQFYAAEDYHQNFYKKNPERYYSYREGCRRDARLRQLWGEEGNAPPKS